MPIRVSDRLVGGATWGDGIRGLCPLIRVFDMPTPLRFYRDAEACPGDVGLVGAGAEGVPRLE